MLFLTFFLSCKILPEVISLRKSIYIFTIAIVTPTPTLTTLPPKPLLPQSAGNGNNALSPEKIEMSQVGDLTSTAAETQDNREEKEKKGEASTQ